MEFEFRMTPNGILLIANGQEIGVYKTMMEATRMADSIRNAQETSP